MGLMDNLTSQVDEITGQSNAGGASFPKTLTTDDFMAGDVDVPAGEYVKLGEFVVPAQEAYRWGKGTASFEANQGYVYILIQNATPAEVTGTVRLQQRDAQERNIVTVFEERADVLHESKANRDQQVPLPEQQSYPKVGKNSKLAIAFRSDAADTVSKADTDILLPVTVYPQSG